MNQIQSIYDALHKKYGPQGWWPLLELHENKQGINPTKSGSMNGYHPNDFSYPKNYSQRFEICIGAILTQNTSWKNVEKALVNLRDKKLLDARKMLLASDKVVSGVIKPAGYFNQKTKKLKIFAKFYLSLKGKIPTRDKLLNVWGIGSETADSILLYAYRKTEFVVDAYTRRMLTSMKIIDKKRTYGEIKSLFEKNLPKDYKLFQEYHALIVEDGKHTLTGKKHI